MRTNTSQYRNAHGTEPRGRGFWFFSMEGTDVNGNFVSFTDGAMGTFSEARRTVAQRFRDAGARRVTEATVLT